MNKRRIAAVVVTATTAIATTVAAQGEATAAPSTSAIANTKPTWTAHAAHLGRAAKSGKITARVYLQPKGGTAAVARAVAAVSTPGSASYHHFLSVAAYNARFGTTDATVSSVSHYLRAKGLKVTGVGASNRYVSARGSVKAAEQAFGTTIETYRHGSARVQAPTSALHVPSSLAGSVLTVTGLDTTSHTMAPTSTTDGAPAGFRNARPCSTYFGQLPATVEGDFTTALPKFKGKTLSYAPCGYTGPQFRAAYEKNTRLDGSGITVAIVDAYAAPTIVQDSNLYATTHGDGSYAPGQLTQVVPAKFEHPAICGPTGWFGEETLDVEAVHAMAPGAKIRYYGGVSCEDDDLTDTLGTVVDENKVSLVTNSYGDLGEGVPTDEIAASEAVFMQGALQGISFLFSSGDDGDDLAATGLKQADYEASDPYITAVGGTSTAIGGSGKLDFQAGWGTEKYGLSADGTSWSPIGFLYGAGGGSSTLFNQPSYQAGVTTSAYRQVPDVAMDADPNTGMLIGETQDFPEGRKYSEYRIGGTSLSSPLFAGLTALALQAGPGTRAGFLNPKIYATPKAFTDVAGKPQELGDVRADFANGLDASKGVLYSVRTFGQDASLAVTTGYDQVTGVGVPNTTWLASFVKK